MFEEATGIISILITSFRRHYITATGKQKAPAGRGGKGNNIVTKYEIKKMLEEQLKLLSERAKTAPDPLLIELSHQMVEIARLLMDA